MSQKRKPITYRHKTTGELLVVEKYERNPLTGKMDGLVKLVSGSYRAVAMDLLEHADKAIIEAWTRGK